MVRDKYIISIDMGGTKVLAAVINSKNKIIFKLKKGTKAKNKKIDYSMHLAGIINELLRQLKLKEDQIKAICLGIPGSVNPLTGLVEMAPNLNLTNYNIKKELSKHTKIPILVENDVNLAALGIKYFEYKQVKNLLAVFIGTGIGGGIIIDNKLYRGATFFAGEIGHITVSKNGPMCGCGRKGCFEATASRTAIVRDIIYDIKNGSKSVLEEMVKEKKQIKSKSLMNAVKQNDQLVKKHIGSACNTIGTVLANLNNFLNFEMIVLGGGVIEALEKFMMPKIKISFRNNSLKTALKGVKIAATKLGDDAALYGGIALAKELFCN